MASTTSTEPTTADVRKWARAQGLAVGLRGALSAEVWEKYRQAHS